MKWFTKVIYSFFKLAGHPIHIDHILDGSFSSMDVKTLKYHFKMNRHKLTDGQITLLNSIIAKRKCESEIEMKAIETLKSEIDLDAIHIAEKPFFWAFSMVPLIAGVLATIIALFEFIPFNVSTSSIIQDDIQMLIERNDLLRMKYEMEINELRNNILNIQPDSLEENIEKIAQEIWISNIDTIDDSIPNYVENVLAYLPSLVKTNSNRISELVNEKETIDSINYQMQNIIKKLGYIESLVIENPESIINLRLLQRDVLNLQSEILDKVDKNLLQEKEKRLEENVNKDINGLSRELSVLRWVIYLLVVGLTASGGVMVAMRRRS